MHIDNFILRTMNIHIEEPVEIEWDKYCYPHPSLYTKKDPEQFTDHSVYRFGKFRDSPHPN